MRAVALGATAAVLLLGVAIFLCMSGFFWLRTHFPPFEAALLMAAVLFALTIISCLSLTLAGRRGRPAPRPASTIAEEVAPLVDTLKAAGCTSEAAALLAGSQLAAQIRPYYLVAAAIVVGLILGRKFDSRPPSDKSRQP